MATGKKSAKNDERFRDIAQNRRALHEYAITDRFEAGIVLQGSEVKGLRESGATISDAYVQIRNGEAWLIGAHFSDYENAGYAGHDPRRTRKLLLHRKEIEKIASALAERGLSVVPLRLYFKEGRAKIELALARGKKMHDKRESVRERDAAREMDRARKSR